ncbi:hypothetical protein XBKQ1_2140020 [Xenorhabdus bovienii str. kraussei Quebec]|uniref:Uncharacterized protein n=1 Tax=Xenorhabdus bovienii str. kraussei Quebec TaxID=1398203 RepID=A0A077PE48_XENBV|nr:hypothetical protein XBKQ1_2140020 [Xenorhabdus bovienii str. kraussei Quebec]
MIKFMQLLVDYIYVMLRRLNYCLSESTSKKKIYSMFMLATVVVCGGGYGYLMLKVFLLGSQLRLINVILFLDKK